MCACICPKKGHVSPLSFYPRASVLTTCLEHMREGLLLLGRQGVADDDLVTAADDEQVGGWIGCRKRGIDCRPLPPWLNPAPPAQRRSSNRTRTTASRRLRVAGRPTHPRREGRPHHTDPQPHHTVVHTWMPWVVCCRVVVPCCSFLWCRRRARRALELFVAVGWVVGRSTRAPPRQKPFLWGPGQRGGQSDRELSNLVVHAQANTFGQQSSRQIRKIQASRRSQAPWGVWVVSPFPHPSPPAFAESWDVLFWIFCGAKPQLGRKPLVFFRLHR